MARSTKAKKVRTRLGPDERRKQLLRVASKLLSAHGVDGLQFTALATEAGVSRPIVYKFFPNRQALIMGVLEELEAELTARFFAVVRQSIPASLEAVTRLFIDAICDAIEENGAGAWHLLDAKGQDPDVAQLGREIQARLMAPWHAHIAAATGATPRDVETVTVMLVAAGRAVLEQWYAGSLTRAAAARAATRGVSALLTAFTVEGRSAGPGAEHPPRPRTR